MILGQGERTQTAAFSIGTSSALSQVARPSRSDAKLAVARKTITR